MKKLLILLIPLLLVGAGCNSNSSTPEEDVEEGIEVVEDLLEETGDEYKVRGSCDTIATASHCLDYIGSFWTEEQMSLNCKGGGTYSKTTCPYSDNGGCRAGAGTITENVIWSYDRGGNPISGENVVYEAKACDANPLADWVTPDQLFLK
jgi:hypothetical protein